jgi:hypothetical protein
MINDQALMSKKFAQAAKTLMHSSTEKRENFDRINKINRIGGQVNGCFKENRFLTSGPTRAYNLERSGVLV